MKTLMMICALSLIGMAACMERQDAAAVPADEVTERAPVDDDLANAAPALEAALADDSARVCCTDYVCPPTGFETSGCVGGSPSPSQAKAACNAACAVPCQTLGTYCD